MDLFAIIDAISEGYFGKVYTIRKKGGIDDRKLYAVKRMSITRCLNDTNYLKSIKNERVTLHLVRGQPFLSQMHYAFVTADHINIVLDYAHGGDLGVRLEKIKRFSLNEVRLCAAEVLMALKFLHQQKICYRDLKTENILIDATGHMVLTDFGLATKLDDDCSLDRLCGTFEYMAPEILLETGYRFEVDWWAYGVLIFELLTGYVPFQNDEGNNEILKQRILNEPPNMIRIKYVTDDEAVFDVIECLLTKAVENRLGSGPNDYKDIQSHQFFSNIDWNKLIAKGYKVLSMPELDVAPTHTHTGKPHQTIEINNSKSNNSLLILLQDYFYKAPDLIETEYASSVSSVSSQSSVANDMPILKINYKLERFRGFENVLEKPDDIPYEQHDYKQYVSLYETEFNDYVEIKKIDLKAFLTERINIHRSRFGVWNNNIVDMVSSSTFSGSNRKRQYGKILLDESNDEVRRSKRIRREPDRLKFRNLM